MSIKLNDSFQSIILEASGAKELRGASIIQNLWSGYGKIIRYGLKGSEYPSVVVKHVKFPNEHNHPRGWNTDISHERKLRSYEVEVNWYQNHADQCDDSCRLPRCFALESHDDEVLMVMEDLDAAGFPGRKNSVSWGEMKACISWLAHFHATFLGEDSSDLWPIGTYWHLDTRPDELDELDDEELKQAAPLIDKRLNNCKYKTIVHGDAKLANFCFSRDGKKVAAVDFQYVGGGCGMKDLAYFIGSCLYEEECERLEGQLLDFYFQELKGAISQKEIVINFHELESEWRELFPWAWTDFHRFLKGWSPGHWKINSYSERLEREILAQLKLEINS